MSYNLLAECDRAIPWEDLHNRLQPFTVVEYVPMPGLGIGGGDALGLSVPQKQAGEYAWQELCRVMAVLQSVYGLALYDMYYGERVVPAHLERIREAVM